MEFPRTRQRRFVGDDSTRTTDADLQPRAESVLGALRLRGEIVGYRDLVAERERHIPFPEDRDGARTPDACGDAGSVPRGLPTRARQGDPGSTTPVRVVLGDVNRRCELVSAGQVLHARWLSWLG